MDRIFASRALRSALITLGLTACAAAAHAQMRAPVTSPKNWVSLGGLMYTDIASFSDPDTQSRWLFDGAAFGASGTLLREVSPGLLLGVDVSYALPRYERRGLASDAVIASGTAAVGTAMATGRFAYGGGGAIGIYLTGGLGAIGYRLEDAEWNPDFALRAGTGLEYQFGANKAAALEWGRIWGYHEKEDLGGGNQQHSVLKLIGRIGF